MTRNRHCHTPRTPGARGRGLLLVACLALTACGGGGASIQDEATDSATPSAATASTATTPGSPAGLGEQREVADVTLDTADTVDTEETMRNLWHPDEAQRELAIDDFVSGDIEDDGVLQLLATDPDPDVRQVIVDSLLDNPTQRNRQALIDLLQDPDPAVRQAVEEAMLELGM